MLNNHQKAYLRSIANHLKPIVTIGKEGISDTLIESLDNALTAHELVKVNYLKSCPISQNELKIELARLSHSEIIQVIGHSIILYRKKNKDGMVLPK